MYKAIADHFKTQPESMAIRFFCTWRGYTD